jgi:fatty acid-binding protein DegV
LRPARGSRLARRRIVDIWAREVAQEQQRGARLHVAALHALEPGVAEELLAEVRRRYEPTTAFVGAFSPVMVAHTGPGLVGLAWWWDEAGDR